VRSPLEKIRGFGSRDSGEHSAQRGPERGVLGRKGFQPMGALLCRQVQRFIQQAVERAQFVGR